MVYRLSGVPVEPVLGDGIQQMRPIQRGQALTFLLAVTEQEGTGSTKLIFLDETSTPTRGMRCRPSTTCSSGAR